jgi:hypothetical protein
VEFDSVGLEFQSTELKRSFKYFIRHLIIVEKSYSKLLPDFILSFSTLHIQKSCQNSVKYNFFQLLFYFTNFIYLCRQKQLDLSILKLK